jgi:methylase of polypeptide subunit release factors
VQGAETLDPADLALLELLGWLSGQAYDFVAPTPGTHARVLRRRDQTPARGLRDILGWSLPFRPAEAPRRLMDLLAAAGALTSEGDLMRSAIRVSGLSGRLFIHSAYPTDATDAVFFGPDSYRFAEFVSRETPSDFAGQALDIGGGCGPGAISLIDRAPRARVTVTDVNPLALRYARVAAHHAGLAMRFLQADGLRGAPVDLDLVIANPPYMAASTQTYRDGGDMHGARLSLDWARGALMHLNPGGRMCLYTGSAIETGGLDRLRTALEQLCAEAGANLDYREIDPDVFGEELERRAYADVERIAVIGCVLTAGVNSRAVGG